MALRLQTLYWDDLRARSAFKEFIMVIHGVDFAEWDSAGYWDEAYMPFSFFEGEKVIASVCLYLLPAVINGRACQVAQISGVGTLPEWRRKGLNRELTTIALEYGEGRYEGLFLFSDEEAIPFYHACGFVPAEEFIERIEAPEVRPRSGIIQRDPGSVEDRALLYRYAERRAPISNRFSAGNKKLFMFHTLYLLRDDIYEIPDLDCLVLYRRKAGHLTIFDIVGEKVPPFNELYPYIREESDRTIDFRFYTDKLGIDKVEREMLKGNNVFVKEGFPVEEVVFPFTCKA